MSASFATENTPLVAREREVAVCSSWLQETAAGHGGIALVSGSLGVGKSVLLEEIARQANAAGFYASAATVERGARSRPPWPWPTLLRRIGLPECRELSRKLMLDGSIDPARTEPMIPGGAGGSHDLAGQLCELLARVTARHPVVFAVDGGENLDTASLALLRIIADSLEDHPFLVVVAATLDSEETEGQSRIVDELVAAAGDRALRVEPLGHGALETLLGEETTEAIGGVGAAMAITGGVPLLAHSLAANRDFSAGSDIPIRDRVLNLARERYRRLGREDRELVEVCAICDGPVDDALVAVVLNTSQADIRTRVSAMGTMSMIRIEEDATSTSLSLYPASVSGAISETLDSAGLASRHAALAMALLRRVEQGRIPDVDAIARHAIAAGDRIPSEVTARWALQAAKEANRVGVHPLAGKWASAGLDALLRGGETGEPGLRLNLLVAEFDAAIGEDTSRARDRLTAILRLAREEGVERQVSAFFGILQLADFIHCDAEVKAVLLEAMDDLIGKLPSDARELPQVLAGKAFVLQMLPGVERTNEAAAIAREARRRWDALDGERGVFPAFVALYCDPWGESPEKRIETVRQLREMGPVAEVEVELALTSIEFEECSALGDRRAAAAAGDRMYSLLRQEHGHRYSWLHHHRRAAEAVAAVDREAAVGEMAQSLAGAHSTTAYILAYAATFVTHSQLEEFTGEWLPIEGLVPLEERHYRRASSREGRGHEGIVLSSLFDGGGEVVQAAITKGVSRSEDPSSARDTLDTLADHEFSSVARKQDWLPCMLFYAEAAAELRHARASAMLLELLRPFAHQFHVRPMVLAYSGLISGFLAPLAEICGDLDEAETLARSALAQNEEARLVYFATADRINLARILLARGRRDEALALAAEAGERIESLDLPRLRRLHGALGLKRETIDVETPDGAGSRPCFQRNGEIWRLRWRGEECQFRDQRGLVFMHALVARPRTDFHVQELVTLGQVLAPEEGTLRPARGEELGGPSADGIETLDEQALAAYRERLREIDTELFEAQDHTDLGRIESITRERDALLTEVQRASGLGGRRRKTNSDVERARTAVRKRIKATMDRIRRELPGLHAHFERSIRTGVFCSYEPEDSLDWEL